MYKLLIPSAQADDICKIDIRQLKQKGIKGIILDLDNTIVPWGGRELSCEVAAWLKNICGEGFKITILSNSRPKRVASIAETLSLPYIADAGKPIKSSFYKALALMSLSPQEAAVIGDQLFTDILGGNIAGIYTIWIKPISKKEFIITRLLNRNLEKVAVRILENKKLFKKI